MGMAYVTISIDIDILIYLLTAIGLTPGGSSTVHIYTQYTERPPPKKTNSTQNNTKIIWNSAGRAPSC
jgi:hypothetical protein